MARAGGAAPAAADVTFTQQAELEAADGAANHEFGYEVALSGNGGTALVAANTANASIGAAYVFVWTGSSWSQQAELTTSDGQSGDQFGDAVALSSDGSIALVGAPDHNNYTGAVYKFVRGGNSWTQQQEITASDGVYFGRSVALSSDGATALIGAPLGASGQEGAAYVFGRSGASWSQQELTINAPGQATQCGGRGPALYCGAAKLPISSPPGPA